MIKTLVLRFLKNAFLFVRHVLNRILKKYKKILIDSSLQVIKIQGFKNTFFGYYDVSPFNHYNSKLILFHANNLCPNRNPNIKIKTALGYYNTETLEYTIFDYSNTWNWQQGSRLQWLNEHQIIYNNYNFEKERVFAKIFNIRTNESKELPININAIFNDNLIISNNYYSLTKFSEYGYTGITENDDENQIKLYDIKSGCVKDLFEIDDLFQFLVDIDNIRMAHINHILFNLDGNSFAFILRYYIAGNRIDNLFLYSFENNKIKLILGNQIISHYTWKDVNNLLIWGIYNGEKAYFLLNLKEGSINKEFSDDNDGHPTYINSDTIITDNYPVLKSLTQSLYTINFKTKEKREILKLLHPFNLKKDTRCDFHPSIHKEKMLFQIDTRHYYWRSIIIGKLN